jgi:D-cysteine desulfhydrase
MIILPFKQQPIFKFALLLIFFANSTSAFLSPSSSSSSWSSSLAAHSSNMPPTISATSFLQTYKLPSFATRILLKPLPPRVIIANTPTPVHAVLSPPSALKKQNAALFLKRDDMTGGLETGGNKVRKLEFLIGDAISKGHDSIVTIGGEQSNHVRATAACARMFGLQPHLILRAGKPDADLSYVGNLLYDRLMGSKIHLVSKTEYTTLGSKELVSRLCKDMKEAKKEGECNPYSIPVGGSNAVGTIGYIEAVREFVEEQDGLNYDHIVVACGSGGSTAGIALGIALAADALKVPRPKVHAVCVCDNPDYFYEEITKIAKELKVENISEEEVRQMLTIYQGKGVGYAMNTSDETKFISDVGRASAFVLDPVYTGKAMYNFCKIVDEDREAGKNSFEGSKVLFWHTGGGLGLYDKVSELQAFDESTVERMKVP